ncbi:hypothetical protein M8494_20665 [Serratia ureilytica]
MALAGCVSTPPPSAILDCDERLSNAAPELLAIPPKPAEPVADSLPAASSITPPTTANGAKH